MNRPQAKYRYKQLGHELLLKMRELGLSLRDLSKKTRIGHCTIHRFIKGKPIDVFAFMILTQWEVEQ